MSDVEVETTIILRRMVRRIFMKKLGYTGPMYQLGLEFARRYLYALKKGDDRLKKDIRDVYRAFGLPRDVIQEIARELEERYS